MNYLIMWLTTIVLSNIMDFANYMRLYKDLADSGYKFNMEKLKEFGLNTNNENKILRLIPGLNMLNSVKKTMTYNDIRENAIDSLRVMNMLEEMTKEELNEYQKKPTGYNALKIANKTENLLNNLPTMTTENGSKYWFHYDINDKVTIYKVTGPDKYLKEKEQQESVQKVLDIFFNEVENNNFDNLGVFFNIDDQKIPVVVKENENDQNEEMSLDEKIRELRLEKRDLESLKEDFLRVFNIKKKDSQETSEEDKQKTYIKK